jgi:peptidoglycan/xylan/chitin deacetylase (PgdA/CDA1 family)
MRQRTTTPKASLPGEATGHGILLQRKCACGGASGPSDECETCREKKLQRRSENLDLSSIRHPPSSVSEVPPIVQEVLRSPGQELNVETRAFMEPRFGHDFSGVRVHTDVVAAESARQLKALAYTVGRNIVFENGRYRPETLAGQRLLAHELTHVAQQSLHEMPSRWLNEQTDPDERGAEQTAAALGWGELHPYYRRVASDVTWHSTPRTLSIIPTLSSAGSLIQRVQLTYDDGPDSAGNTRNVLTALNAAGARATFYLVGKRVAQGDNWRIVFDIAAAGHWIGNHAYDWNDATDNHIFLHGTTEERAEKILNTEWAIRDALTQGRADAQKNNKWNTIAAANRDYINDVIAHGTGRFRTPGFRSHLWSKDGVTTMAAIESANHVLAATGLRPLAITEVGFISREGVDVDPEDWKAGRTQQDVESGVKGKLSSNAESILLHSRIGASAAATPAILSDIKSRKFTFDATVQGQEGSVRPKPGFAGLSTISDPPTSAEVDSARAFLKKNMLTYGPFISGGMAIGIFQLAQRVGATAVSAFVAEIKGTTVQTKDGPVPMANWMMANEEWRLFAGFFENWMTNKPFPRIKGVTI